MPLQLHMSRSSGLSSRGIPQRSSFETWINTVLVEVRHRKTCEISLRIVDAEEGRSLNQQYRNRDYSTNVLSFPADLPPGVKLPLLGDLAICAPIVAREAGEQNKPLRDHYAHMTVHGTLHLLGFDHEIDTEAERMEALERKVLHKLQIADPYESV